VNESTAIDAQPPVEPRKRRGIPVWLIIVAAVVGLVAVCAGGVAYFFLDAAAEVDDIEVVLEEFLTATSEGDINHAYSLFSTEAKQSVAPNAFRQSVPNQAAYHTFERLERGGWQKSFESGRPTIFAYNGTVWHENGDRDDLYAEMVKEDGAWKIRYIEVQ
jgi:hypothetical protein